MPAPVKTRSFALILMAGSFVTAVSLGARSTMGVFLDPISQGLDLGTSTFALSVAIQNLIWGLGQPVAGAVADRYGSVRVLLVGAAVYAIGLLVVANASTGLELHLGAGLIMGVGLAAASFSVVLAALGRLVPPERRSMALGVATAFGSVGQFILVPVSQYLITTAGWRVSMGFMAAVVAAIVVAVGPLKTRSAAPSPDPSSPAGPEDEGDETLRQVLARAGRHRSYLLLNAGFFVCGFHVTFIGVHLPKHLEDVGQPASVATWALAAIGLFNIVGSFTAGALGQRRSKTRLLSIIYGARAVTFLVLLLLPPSAGAAFLFAALMGLFWLATVPLTSGVVLGQFGVRHAGTLFGLVFFSHQVGAFIGSWGGGAVRDATGSYAGWWWTSVALAVAAAVIHLFIDEGPANLAAAPTPTRSGRWRLGRPRLAPAAATMGAAAAVLALAGLAVATTDASAAGLRARQAAVLCSVHPGGDPS